MAIHRILYPRQCSISSVVELTDKKIIHKLRNIVRLKKGDVLCLFDGKGTEYGCRIEMMGKENIRVFVESAREREGEPAVKIQLGLALIKEPRLEIAVEKATELGVDSIVLFPAERSTKRQVSASRVERLKRIITEASRQSGRRLMPELSVSKTLLEFIKGTQDTDCRVFLESFPQASHDIEKTVQQAGNILLSVGPEGDFTEIEKALLKENGFIPWHFPLPVLRTETAAMFGVGLVRYLINK